jgi:S-adenosylmethionine decarboxylase
MPNSIHIIADFSGCPLELLEYGKSGDKILEQAVQESGLNCVLIRYHQFSPVGYTAAALLTESHITLHTWPEYESVQIDIFTCGSHENAKKSYQILKRIFKPGKICEKTFYRKLNNITEQN